MVTRFDGWAYDSDTRELRSGSRRVDVTAKAFDLLGALLAERPRAVSKVELQERLWPKTFVTESNLTKLMAELRKALGDDARAPRYLRTVRGFGYAFSGPAQAAPGLRRASASVECRLVWGEREVVLAQGESVLGRSEDAAVWIDAASVSRRHARILVEGDHVFLEDLGSKNGTFLRGERVSTRSPLSDGDNVCLGSEWIAIRIRRGARSTKTVPGAQPDGSGP
jgi:DNA-binding winged helix-turn-helix (wHTH) protein